MDRYEQTATRQSRATVSKRMFEIKKQLGFCYPLFFINIQFCRPNDDDDAWFSKGRV